MTESVLVKDYRAYYLPRTDLPSLGRGKGLAHSMHAGNDLTWQLVAAPLMSNQKVDEGVLEWHRQGGGFGTTIALGRDNEVSKAVLDQLIDFAKRAGIKCNKVLDTSYPYFVDDEIMGLIDKSVHALPPSRVKGGWVCYRAEVTGAWIFGDKSELEPLLARFGLVPE